MNIIMSHVISRLATKYIKLTDPPYLMKIGVA
jgi:hypothetical protein